MEKKNEDKNGSHGPASPKTAPTHRRPTTGAFPDYMSNVILSPLGSDPERDKKIMAAWRQRVKGTAHRGPWLNRTVQTCRDSDSRT